MYKIKEKIEKCIAIYKNVYPQEFEAAKEIISEQRKIQVDRGNFKGKKSTDYLERLIVSYPQALLQIMMNTLNDQEMKYINSREGVIWFAKNFSDFSIPESDKL